MDNVTLEIEVWDGWHASELAQLQNLFFTQLQAISPSNVTVRSSQTRIKTWRTLAARTKTKHENKSITLFTLFADKPCFSSYIKNGLAFFSCKTLLQGSN